MPTILLLARLVLAGVFLIAGLAKLADRDGSRRALVEFGVPPLLAIPFGVLLPVVEIIVGIGLIPRATADWSAVGALMLLTLFCIGIAVNLMQGREPDCHCFGQLHSAPAGWQTLVRNALLAGVSGFVVWQGWGDPGRSIVGVADSLSTGQVVVAAAAVAMLAAIAIEGSLILNLLQQQGRLLARVEALESGSVSANAVPKTEHIGLSLGSVAPDFQLRGLHGETMTLAALRAASKPVMLVFSDPGCGPCNALMPDIGRWQRDENLGLTVALVSRGAAEANRSKSAEHGLTNVLLQEDREVAEAYRSRGTPAAVLIRSDGTIGSGLAQGAGNIRDLVATVSGQQIANVVVPTNGHKPQTAIQSGVGVVAPDIKLPDINGTTVDLADLRGHETLVVFWNPRCGYCQRMLNDLREWEATAPTSAPHLLVVSTGTAQQNRAQGLTSTIVLDEGFQTGRRFGAGGTPSAVLIDAEGRIASDVAVGAPSVMALANREAVESAS
ncbi:MAG: redoxin domain-containing protein [Thermomicrobiales bacterium]|nr:redoxin domain-containing protein [Thermomicrobiales bacterium]